MIHLASVRIAASNVQGGCSPLPLSPPASRTECVCRCGGEGWILGEKERVGPKADFTFSLEVAIVSFKHSSSHWLDRHHLGEP